MRLNNFHKTFIATLAMFLLLVACNSGHNAEIYRGLQRAEDLISEDKKDEALTQLFDLENNLNVNTPDTLKYKVLSRIGSIYYSDFKKDKADDYFKKALAVARECGKEYESTGVVK